MKQFESPYARHRRLALRYTAIQSASLILLMFSLWLEHRPPNPFANSGPLASHRMMVVRASVPAESGWVPAGITLPAERVVLIEAKGAVELSAGGAPVLPEGEARTCGEQLAALEPERRADMGCLMADAPYGALVGQVDDGAPFVIGERASIALRRAGRLALAVNICCPDEAVGAFAVTVSVMPFHYEP